MDTPAITPQLLAKYDRPGPRYTSYPTVPAWQDGFGEDAFREALHTAAQSPERPVSLYAHIPFCSHRCAYCGCNTITGADQAAVNHYLAAMNREIELVAEALGERRSAAQLHWGGGTPSYLDTQQMETLFSAFASAFQLRPDAEIAIETNPHTVSDTQLSCLRQLGFNRISFGVQDLNATVQQAIGREQTADQTHQAIARCRALGFCGINMDLIYGLPLQVPETWAETITGIIGMHPDRIAIYSYAHLPQRFPHQRALDGLPLPDATAKYTLFAQARQQLLEAGYVAIGMDHFALPGDELAQALRQGTLHRNFMGYTVMTAPDQVGFGLSAISEVADRYGQNTKDISQFTACLKANKFPTERGMVLSADDRMRRWVIRRLMCTFSLNVHTFETTFGRSFDAYFKQELVSLRTYEEEGMIIHSGQEWRVTALGAVFVRNICMIFDAYLNQQDRPLFSRTI